MKPHIGASFFVLAWDNYRSMERHTIFNTIDRVFIRAVEEDVTELDELRVLLTEEFEAEIEIEEDPWG